MTEENKDHNKINEADEKKVKRLATPEKSPRIFRIFSIAQEYKSYENTRIAAKQPQILYYLIRWQWLSRSLRLIHVTLGLFAIFFSLLAAAQIGSISDVYVKIFAFIAALSVGILTAFNLNTKSNNMRTAWRELNFAAMRYNSSCEFTDEQLIEQYRKSESLIGDVTYTGSG